MKYLIPAFVICLFVSCKENSADQNDTDKIDTTSAQIEEIEESINEMDEPVATTQKIYNSRFDFSFEIPSGWKAADKSNNGDGFYINTGNTKVDLRIYGEAIKGNEIVAEMELQACDKTEKFIFRNGYPGLKCFQDKDEYYYYDTPETRIVFFVHADETWKKENAEVISNIAKSINSGRQNFE